MQRQRHLANRANSFSVLLGIAALRKQLNAPLEGSCRESHASLVVECSEATLRLLCRRAENTVLLGQAPESKRAAVRAVRTATFLTVLEGSEGAPCLELRVKLQLRPFRRPCPLDKASS